MPTTSNPSTWTTEEQWEAIYDNVESGQPEYAKRLFLLGKLNETNAELALSRLQSRARRLVDAVMVFQAVFESDASDADQTTLLDSYAEMVRQTNQMWLHLRRAE